MVGVRRSSRKGRPNHAVEFKRRLAMAACEPGVSVAKLALEHRINANLLFKWRRHFRAGKFGEPAQAAVGALGAKAESAVASAPSAFQLLPVVESMATVGAVAVAQIVPERAVIEVVFPYATVRIHGVAEPDTLRAVLDCLARRR